MIAFPLLVAVLLALPQNAQGPAGGTSPNACVTCHEQLPATTAAGHSFQDWRASPHGRAGATCDKCHGGNPDAADRQAAHRDVYSSRESRSKVYYTRIPATCGSCHQQELGFFTESRHYTRLVTSGRGPNCVTCHGSMAIQVLSPPDLEATCSACHNPEQRAPSPAPVAARYLLVLLGQVEFGIRVTEALAAKTPEPSMRQAATRYLRQAGNSMQRVREGWHSFDLGLVEEMLLQTADAARLADSSLAGGAKR